MRAPGPISNAAAPSPEQTRMSACVHAPIRANQRNGTRQPHSWEVYSVSKDGSAFTWAFAPAEPAAELAGGSAELKFGRETATAGRWKLEAKNYFRQDHAKVCTPLPPHTHTHTPSHPSDATPPLPPARPPARPARARMH